VPTYEDLAALSDHERAVLMRHLIELQFRDPLAEPVNLHRRRRFLVLLTGACVWLVPWIVYLALTLPKHYDAGAWQVAWVGFDVMLLTGLSVTAYMIWRKRQLSVVPAIITGTLLICDAWFDMTLSAGRSDFAVTVITALFGELPLAALMFFFVGRILFLTIRLAWANLGHEERMPPLWRLRMFSLVEPVVQTLKEDRST
jgi:hypothetical protein